MNIMRKIDSIIIHCSATKVGQDFTAADIGRTMYNNRLYFSHDIHILVII